MKYKEPDPIKGLRLVLGALPSNQYRQVLIDLIDAATPLKTPRAKKALYAAHKGARRMDAFRCVKGATGAADGRLAAYCVSLLYAPLQGSSYKEGVLNRVLLIAKALEIPVPELRAWISHRLNPVVGFL